MVRAGWKERSEEQQHAHVKAMSATVRLVNSEKMGDKGELEQV